MRVFLLISKDGDAWSLAQRIQEEGHRALVYINNPEKRNVGNGIVEKHPEQNVLIDDNGKVSDSVLKEVLHPKPDCCLMDMVGRGFGQLADRLVSMGYPVVGGNAWADRVELDRSYGAKVMNMVKIDTPKTYTFDNYDKAILFVQEKGIPFVYKPSSNQSTTTTYVAQGADDLIGMLEYYATDIKEEFVLQEKVEGVEVSSEMWFNGKDVVSVNHTMEEKAMLDGGRGPKGGCYGSVVWLGDTGSKLYKEGIGKIVPALRKIKYRGTIDLNAIVTKDKVYGLEWTARFGYDALFVLLDMYKGRVNDLLYGLASGVLKDMYFRSPIGVGVDLSVPPYPYGIEPDYYKDVLIQGINRHNMKHLWLYDTYKKDGRYLCAGCGGDVGTVTARGDSIENWSPLRDAKRRVMRTIKNLVIPDVLYRTDIGDRVPRDIDILRKQGWLPI